MRCESEAQSAPRKRGAVRVDVHETHPTCEGVFTLMTDVDGNFSC